MQSNFSTLCRGFLVPKEIKDKETVTKFLEAVGQFESIMNDSGFITLTRLTSDEITGTKETAGIVEKYFSLSQTDTTTLKDIQLNAEDMRIGDDILCLHTLSDAEICRARWELIPAMKSYPPTGAIADYLLLLRWACCSPVTISITSTSSLTTIRKPETV